MSDQLLTIKDVATRLKIGRTTAYTLVEDGEIPARRIGKGRGTLRVKPADLERYINRPPSREAPALVAGSGSLYD
jgi:excisionase family DNA binding protein